VITCCTAMQEIAVLNPGRPQNFGCKKHQILDHFSATSTLDTTYLWNETSHGQTKMLCQSTICPLQGDLLSVTFDPETAEIRLLIVTQLSEQRNIYSQMESTDDLPARCDRLCVEVVGVSGCWCWSTDLRGASSSFCWCVLSSTNCRSSSPTFNCTVAHTVTSHAHQGSTYQCWRSMENIGGSKNAGRDRTRVC